MSESLKILLVGGPMYDPLYERIGEFEESEGMGVEEALEDTEEAARRAAEGTV